MPVPCPRHPTHDRLRSPPCVHVRLRVALACHAMHICIAMHKHTSECVMLSHIAMDAVRGENVRSLPRGRCGGVGARARIFYYRLQPVGPHFGTYPQAGGGFQPFSGTERPPTGRIAGSRVGCASVTPRGAVPGEAPHFVGSPSGGLTAFTMRCAPRESEARASGTGSFSAGAPNVPSARGPEQRSFRSAWGPLSFALSLRL